MSWSALDRQKDRGCRPLHLLDFQRQTEREGIFALARKVSAATGAADGGGVLVRSDSENCCFVFFLPLTLSCCPTRHCEGKSDGGCDADGCAAHGVVVVAGGVAKTPRFRWQKPNRFLFFSRFADFGRVAASLLGSGAKGRPRFSLSFSLGLFFFSLLSISYDYEWGPS